jgi:hypothetical protein
LERWGDMAKHLMDVGDGHGSLNFGEFLFHALR